MTKPVLECNDNQRCQPTCTREMPASSHRRSSSPAVATPRMHASSGLLEHNPSRRHQKQTTANRTAASISAISGSLSSLELSSSSSVSASPIVGAEQSQSPNHDTPQRSLRRRPRLSNLQQYQPSPDIRLKESTLHRQHLSLGKKHYGRRSVSAGPTLLRKAIFASPDRYTAVRSSLDISSSPLRTSYHPTLLEHNERLSRSAASPIVAWRSGSGGGRSRTMSRPAPSQLRSFQPPHYTPSFVYRRDGERMTTNSRAVTEPVRHASFGSIWQLGGWYAPSSRIHSVELGNGAVTASGSNAPMIDSTFLNSKPAVEQISRHERRLALALNIDTARRVLPVNEPQKHGIGLEVDWAARYGWANSKWAQACLTAAGSSGKQPPLQPEKVVPSIAFRVLDAPRLKDDYYCSVLAYCSGFRTLAVALTHRVYLWTEKYGVRYPPLAPVRQNNYVTALAFSTDEGGKGILAVSRHSGHVTLWSLLEQKARFEIPHPSPACSLAFRPRITRRKHSTGERLIDCEDLLVRDDVGRIYYYSVEWPADGPGSVSLLTKIEAHSQNVCGLAWSFDGRSFVSGGNDNAALLFDVDNVFRLQNSADFAADLGEAKSDVNTTVLASALPKAVESSPSPPHDSITASSFDRRSNRMRTTMTSYRSTVLNSMPNIANDIMRDSEWAQSLAGRRPPTPPRSPATRSVTFKTDLADPNTIGITNAHRYSFHHSAAVKAIAFAPWQSTLLATSGGSNDRQIHFHHTASGTTLAVVNVFAQVTSLIWSLTRREIVATFGYAQPEHDTRIAVFAWPSCECVVSIPWERKANGEVSRALWAIPYPGGPNDASPERLQEESESYRNWHSPHSGRQSFIAGPHARGRTLVSQSPETATEREAAAVSHSRIQTFTRGEGEVWASRTQEEGSIIIACCDQTVKFFEVWAGKSKGKSLGLGSKAGVLGGSKVLEGWCDDIVIEEVGASKDVIR